MGEVEMEASVSNCTSESLLQAETVIVRFQYSLITGVLGASVLLSGWYSSGTAAIGIGSTRSGSVIWAVKHWDWGHAVCETLCVPRGLMKSWWHCFGIPGCCCYVRWSSILNNSCQGRLVKNQSVLLATGNSRQACLSPYLVYWISTSRCSFP